VSEKNWNLLREYLLTSYGELVGLLAHKLKSRERAEEALQDTFEKLERNSGEIAVLQSPRGYLLQMATRVALDRARSEHRYAPVSAGKVRQPQVLTVEDGRAFIHQVDDAPGPEQIALGRSELSHLLKIMGGLPSRRREIFVAALVDEIPHQEIAKKYGLSLRSVQHELKLAREYCLTRFGREG
jgi:RNA polymerase sigma-70 factor (ECF subfamily)